MICIDKLSIGQIKKGSHDFKFSTPIIFWYQYSFFRFKYIFLIYTRWIKDLVVT